MSGNAMSYGGGPIAQLYDSCGPEHGSSKGPYALCGFIFGGAGANDALPDDETLRLQVGDVGRRFCKSTRAQNLGGEICRVSVAPFRKETVG